jgi:hypothetical protein
MSARLGMAAVPVAALLFFVPIILCAQEPLSSNEIPIEHCDYLPIVKVRIDGADMRFLLDTGATTMLNLKSFSNGRSKTIEVTSWNGTAATSAREVSLPELALGNHHLQNLKLPAIDLSPIGKACGGQIDGILGVDLLGKMGVIIDLQREVASPGAPEEEAKTLYEKMELAMHHCNVAFEAGHYTELEECFDPEIVLYTPQGEFIGREKAMKYLQDRYLKFAPNLRYNMTVHEVKMFGDALWYSYDYWIDSPEEHIAGHGMSMCRRDKGHWRILNLHNSVLEPPLQVGTSARKQN